MIKLLFIVSATLVLTSLGGLSYNRRPQETVMTDKGEATLIQEGVLTGRQRKHSKLFKGYGIATGSKKITGLMGERGDVEVEKARPTMSIPRPLDIPKYLRYMTCQADLIAVGTVKSKNSQLIEEGTFVFTDYDVDVEEVLKNNTSAPVQPGSSTSVTWPGGAIKQNNGRVARALDRSSGLLKTGGRFLLYLKFDPVTGDYYFLNAPLIDSAYELKGGKITQVSEQPLPFGRLGVGDVEVFMSEARTATTDPCEKGAAE